MLVLLICLFDPTTGLEGAGSNQENPASPAPPSPKDVSVLWDYTHGVFCPGYCYDLTSQYSTLASILTSNGYALSTTSSGVDNMDLSPYRIVVINLASNWYSAYTASEADSLAAFVARGGSVLIQSENTGCPNGNLAQVVSRLGMSVGLGDPQECYSSFTSNPTYAQIFAGITPGGVCTAAPGAVGASAPSEIIGWMGGYGAMAGRCVDGQGGVILVSDINLWDNTYLSYGPNNDELLLNVFAWLSSPPCKPIGEGEAPSSPKRLVVSPNPVEDFLTVSFPNGISEAVLYDISGAPVVKIREGTNDLRGLRPGVYIMRVGQRTRRLVKI